MGRSRVQPAGGEPAPGCGGVGGGSRRPAARRSCRPPGPAGRGSVHGPGRARLRLRRRRGGRGSEYRPGAGPGLRRPAVVGPRGPDPRRRPGARGRGLGLEPVAPRHRRHPLHQAGSGVRRVPPPGVVRVGRPGKGRARPVGGSAGEGGRQSRFPGSDRQGRGRLVDALRRGPVPAADIPTSTGWPDQPERAHRVAARLVADGLAVSHEGELRLP